MVSPFLDEIGSAMFVPEQLKEGFTWQKKSKDTWSGEKYTRKLSWLR